MRPAVRLQFQELVPALALAFAALACSGTVGGGQPPTTGGAGSTTTTGSAGNTGSGTAGIGAGPGAGGSITTGAAGSGVQATCPTTAITPTPLRRLTRFEYANTVKNLLNVDVDRRRTTCPPTRSPTASATTPAS